MMESTQIPLTGLETDEVWISPSGLPADATIRASVVIPNFCAEATLLRAVRSALDQTLKEIEVIIVDDASTDGSWQLITGLLAQDPRVRALRNKRNSGKSVGMNHAARVARGRWFAVLDADDWYHPDRLADLTRLGEQYQADMAADNQFFYDAAADQMVGTAWPENTASWELTFDDYLAGSDGYESFNLGMLKPVMAVDFIRNKGLYYAKEARHEQDFFYLLDFYVKSGRAVISNSAYYYYTQPFGSLSRQWSHQNRKRYNFKNALQVNHAYISSLTGSLSANQVRELTRRSAQLERLEMYHRVREALHRRDFLAAARLFASHPGMSDYIFRRILFRLSGQPAYSREIQRMGVRAARRAMPLETVRQHG